MKLIFENWNKWLEEQETPEVDQFAHIRRALKEYFKPGRLGGSAWIKYIMANNQDLKADNLFFDRLGRDNTD